VTDLWTEASRDLEAENQSLRMAEAKVNVARLWPFLALAQSLPEFGHRLALAGDHIANAVPVDLLEPVVSSLVEDFRAVLAAKDAEDEESADEADDDGKPDWLKKKIDKSSLWYHAGLGRWVANDGGPTPQEQAAAEPMSTHQHDYDDPENEDYWKDLGERGPSYWHGGKQAWIRVAAPEEQEGGGNPYYFTGGPEAGPNTGQTNQFPPHPLGSDPMDPINGQFPMTPSAWTVPPGGEWKEQPMQFNPPNPQRTTSSRQVVAVAPGDNGAVKAVKVSYSNGVDWTHTGQHGAAADDNHAPVPSRYSRTAAWVLAGEGVAGRPGQNPNYFGGGGEGVAGDQGGSFPQDMAQGVDPDDRINELYGTSPITGGEVDNGNRVARRTAQTWSGYAGDPEPDNPAPDSGPLAGTNFDSPQEQERWNRAQSGQQQDSRSSTTFEGARHGQFYDPADPSVQVVAAGNPFGGGSSTNPFGSASGETGAPDAAGDMGPNPMLPAGGVPQTTPPRQMPGGAAGGMPPDLGPSQSDQAAPQPTTAVRRTAEGDSLERPTAENPYGTDDPFDAKTWDTVRSQRPMVGLDHMNFNGPQNPGARGPIRTVHSPSQDAGEEDRHEASLVVDRIMGELVRA
jgi:hypothetical protein